MDRAAASGLAIGLAAMVLGACANSTVENEITRSARSADPADVAVAAEHLDTIDAALTRWEDAADLTAARAAAEETRNLITGPSSLGAGDLDGDGEVRGAVTAGLLPGADGQPGLATPLEACSVVERDLLGGSWADPRMRWSTLQTAIAEWTTSNNPFPDLPSHPQRTVGWATLALSATDLDEALEFSGHARTHLEVARNAVAACR